MPGTFPIEVKLKVAGIHRHRDWAHGSHRLFQGCLAALLDPPEGGAVGRFVLDVVAAAGAVLQGRDAEWMLKPCSHCPATQLSPLSVVTCPR